jgi:ABC-type polysaccharide/polyol phosphate transport system ATPase subunit
MESFVSIENASLTFRRWNNPSPQLKEAVLATFSKQKSVSEAQTFECLKNINLRINSGDRLGIVGLNGAGKSTLLKMIVGIYTPTSGCIRVNGQVTPLIELGTGFDPELSGRENIYLNGSMLGRSFNQMKVIEQEIIEFSQLEDFIDQPIKYYSSGMHGRLAFSIATSLNPEILLIDEIFSTGDAQFVGKAQNRMRSLLNNSQIFVLVTHNMEQIKEFCNRAIFLHNGNLLRDGDPTEVVDFYLETIGARTAASKFGEKSQSGSNISQASQLDEVSRVLKEENKALRFKLSALQSASSSGETSGLLAEYSHLAKTLAAEVKPASHPLLLISQVQRSGGNFLNTLLDGHPELSVHPYELHIGHPDKTNWPKLNLDETPKDWFNTLKETHMPRAFLNGYRRRNIQDVTQDDRQQFLLPPFVQANIFEHLCLLKEIKSQRDILDAYMTSFFSAWIDYNLGKTEKKFFTGYVPRLSQTNDSLQRFFEDYPDGYFVSVIRDPRSWLVSERMHTPIQSSQKLDITAWQKSCDAMLSAKEKFGDRVKIIVFESLVLDTETVMRRLCSSIGIDFHSALLTPTFNGKPIKADSAFFSDQYAISDESVNERIHLLEGKEREFIEKHALPIYSTVCLQRFDQQ